MNQFFPQNRSWRPLLACVVIALATVKVYSNSIRVPFIFDDVQSIAENPTIRSLADLRQILAPPAEGETVGGRPVVNLSFALNYAWSGLHVWSWHVVNLAIHLCAGLLLFGIVRRTLLAPASPESHQQRSTAWAFAIALLWSVHPLLTESVTYTVQRAESLAGMFLFATLYCSIRAAHGSARVPWQMAAIGACLLGMATKEVMVVAPVLIVLYDWAFQGDSWLATIRRRPGFYGALCATWLLLATLVMNSASRGGSAGFGQGITVWEYARTQFGFVVLYLKLAVWPHPLVFDYGDGIAAAPRDIYPAALVVACLVVATCAALYSRRYRRLGFLGAWFFCILAPSSSIVPVLTQTGAEHRMYLPLAAVVSLVVIIADSFWTRATARMSALRPALIPAAALFAVALALGISTTRRNADYQSNFSIWNDTVQKRPQNWRALSNLAWMQCLAGDPNLALETYDRSIEISAKFPIPFQGRGDTQLKLGHLELAENDYRRAVELDPLRATARLKLGAVLTTSGKLEPALESLDEAVRLAPYASDAYRARGNVLSRLGRYREAVKDYTEAIRLDPKLDFVYYNRGRCLYALKRHADSVSDFSRAIEINPNQAAYHLNRGIALADLGRYAESADDCSTALRLKPKLVAAYQTRAASYVHLQQYDLARADLARLAGLGTPPDSRILDKLSREAASHEPARGDGP